MREKRRNGQISHEMNITKELLNAGVEQVYCVTVCIGEGY